MKRIFWAMAIALFAVSVHAQDLGDIGNLGGDVNGLLNIPAPRGNAPPGARGATPARGGQPAATADDRLARLRDMFAKANLPLVPEQEAALNNLINREVPLMRQQLQARLADLQKNAANSPTPTRPNPDELLPDLNRLNDQLVGKIAADPSLSVDQQAIVKRALKEQSRSHGGFDALKITMEEASAPFSPEQASQIEELFNQQNQSRAQMLRELQGQAPDPAKLAQLQTDTLRKVLRLLTPAQRAALNTANTK